MQKHTENTQSSSAASPPALNAERQGDALSVTVSGDWTLNNPQTIDYINTFIDGAFNQPVATVSFNTRDLGLWDSSILVLTTKIASLAKSKRLTIVDEAMPIGVRRLTSLALATPTNISASRNDNAAPFLERAGELALRLPQVTENAFAFIGEIILSARRILAGRSSCSISSVWVCVQECGIEALPIVSLISMLVGLILAFVGVVQLRMFGAEIYVSSLVAVGMTRVMGAVMTGVILAGRTGAAYAATLGTMQVNEEIDALIALGVAPSDFLVMPRIIALTCMTPLLVVYSDFMGMFGGFLVGVGALGIEPLEYITFTQKGFVLNNLWVGIIHGTIFGLIIAITGCYQGIRCERSAAAVGLATTSAVVYSIVGIVIATACLTILFNAVGI